ncbi:MAG: hypothetical protein R3E68_17910 [Burkholderiaceae bacterium]
MKPAALDAIQLRLERWFATSRRAIVSSFALSLFAHLLLAALLFLGVRFKIEEPPPVIAELWSAEELVEQPPPDAEPRPDPDPAPETPDEPPLEPPPLPTDPLALAQLEQEILEREAEIRREQQEQLREQALEEKRERELARRAGGEPAPAAGEKEADIARRLEERRLAEIEAARLAAEKARLEAEEGQARGSREKRLAWKPLSRHAARKRPVAWPRNRPG